MGDPLQPTYKFDFAPPESLKVAEKSLVTRDRDIEVSVPCTLGDRIAQASSPLALVR